MLLSVKVCMFNQINVLQGLKSSDYNSSVHMKVYIVGIGGGRFDSFVWTATNDYLIIDYIDIVVSNK